MSKRLVAGLTLTLLAVGTIRAETVEVTVSNFQFTPIDVTIRPGDSVRWVNATGMGHNVVADDASFRSGNPSGTFTYTRQFNTAGNYPYYCGPHGTDGQPLGSVMNGIVRVSSTAAFTINQGIAGTWYEPATAGQGFLMDVEPATRFMFVAWFTYDTPAAGTMSKLGLPEHRWFTAAGTYNGNQATLQVSQTGGGAFDNPRTTTTSQVGTLTLRFDSCTAGTAQYSFPSLGLNGEIALQRAIPGTEALCTTLATPAP